MKIWRNSKLRISRFERRNGLRNDISQGLTRKTKTFKKRKGRERRGREKPL